MTTRTDQVKQLFAVTTTAVQGIEAIGSLIGKANSGSHKDLIDVVRIIEKIVETVMAGFDGKIDPDLVVNVRLRADIGGIQQLRDACDSLIAQNTKPNGTKDN